MHRSPQSGPSTSADRSSAQASSWHRAQDQELRRPPRRPCRSDGPHRSTSSGVMAEILPVLLHTAGCTAWPLLQNAGTCRLYSGIGHASPRTSPPGWRGRSGWQLSASGVWRVLRRHGLPLVLHIGELIFYVGPCITYYVSNRLTCFALGHSIREAVGWRTGADTGGVNRSLVIAIAESRPEPWRVRAREAGR